MNPEAIEPAMAGCKYGRWIQAVYDGIARTRRRIREAIAESKVGMLSKRRKSLKRKVENGHARTR